MNLIQKKNPGHAVSFAINARWGEGTTYFISMWKHEIEERLEEVAVYYNAWENDDCDSAILPLLYNIISVEEDKESENFIEHAKFFFKALGMNTIKFGVSKIFGNYEEIKDVIDKSMEDVNESIKSSFSEYDEYYGKRNKLQDSLKAMVPEHGHLWIFIDDLDRCNPTFAINTLECIKHFFNIVNIIFVFAIDYSHLEKAVEKTYGRETDAGSYMKNFFDAIYQLPSPDIHTYIKCKINNIQNTQIRRLIKDEKLYFYFKIFDYSLRDIDLTMTHIELFFLKHLEKLVHCSNLNLALDIYYYFMVVKDKHNDIYFDIIRGHFLVEQSKDNKWPIIDKKFIISDEIYALLERISNGQAERYTMDIMSRYSLIETPSIKKFSNHMEYVLQ